MSSQTPSGRAGQPEQSSWEGSSLGPEVNQHLSWVGPGEEIRCLQLSRAQELSFLKMFIEVELIYSVVFTMVC